MVPNTGTPVRAHRLRPLNAPRRVFVELSERSLPVAVLEPPPGTATPALGASPGFTRREVETVGEIWRVDDEWWRAPISRRYVEVILKGGKHTVLYHDLVIDEWFEQSI
jgi:hypothetical protein